MTQVTLSPQPLTSTLLGSTTEVNAVVTVDKPKPVSETVAARIDRALALNDDLFAKSAVKGTPAKATLASFARERFGAMVTGSAGLGALGLGTFATLGADAFFPAAIVGAIGAAVAGAIALAVGNTAVTRLVAPRALEIESLRPMVEAYAKADAVDKAVIGNLAQAWLDHLDKRQVTGEYARRQLREIVAASHTLPNDVRLLGERVGSLACALRDVEGGRLSQLPAERSEELRSAVQYFPQEQRSEAAAYVMKALYKNEVCRLRVPNDYRGSARAGCKALLETLVATMPMPALTGTPLLSGPSAGV